MSIDAPSLRGALHSISRYLFRLIAFRVRPPRSKIPSYAPRSRQDSTTYYRLVSNFTTLLESFRRKDDRYSACKRGQEGDELDGELARAEKTKGILLEKRLLAALVCGAIAAAEAYGDVAGEVGAGLRLPFLGKISLGLDGDLGFDGGLFGLGKGLIKGLINRVGFRLLNAVAG
ncbi:unnamed protein product, partial [Iphiclides podalirius]